MRPALVMSGLVAALALCRGELAAGDLDVSREIEFAAAGHGEQAGRVVENEGGEAPPALLEQRGERVGRLAVTGGGDGGGDGHAVPKGPEEWRQSRAVLATEVAGEG